MNWIVIASRILLGLVFVILGLNGFVPFIPAPSSIPPTAGAFFGAMLTSHFSYFVFGVQVICGVLVLINRYMLLAIFTLAAVIANILAFHITMWPQAIVPMPIIALILWFITAWSMRARLAPIFAAT